MASSNIKLFDENKGNMLTDTEFNISTQRLNGLQTGVASSQLQNKAMYQASLVAYAIAQIMMQNGLNANDTDAVSAFVANLSGTMLQKVYDIATTAEAQAGVATGKWMSPALTKAAFNYMKATDAEAKAGTNDTKWMSPALAKEAILVFAPKSKGILSDYARSLYNLGSDSEPDLAFQRIYSMLKDPPTTYDLPKASGIESDGGAYYFKTIDGVVHVYGNICSPIGKSMNQGTAVATLPAGFRPASRRVFAANLTTDAGGTGTQPPSFLIVESNGNISPGNYVKAVGSNSRAYIYMSFSFVAGA